MLFDDYSIAFYMLSAVVALADQSADLYCPINCQCPEITVVNCSSTSINNATFKYISLKVSTQVVYTRICTYFCIMRVDLDTLEKR